MTPWPKTPPPGFGISEKSGRVTFVPVVQVTSDMEGRPTDVQVGDQHMSMAEWIMSVERRLKEMDA